jgi:hypothetical protein
MVARFVAVDTSETACNRTFGSTRDGMAGGWRQEHKEMHHNFVIISSFFQPSAGSEMKALT